MFDRIHVKQDGIWRERDREFEADEDTIIYEAMPCTDTYTGGLVARSNIDTILGELRSQSWSEVNWSDVSSHSGYRSAYFESLWAAKVDVLHLKDRLGGESLYYRVGHKELEETAEALSCCSVLDDEAHSKLKYEASLEACDSLLDKLSYYWWDTLEVDFEGYMLPREVFRLLWDNDIYFYFEGESALLTPADEERAMALLVDESRATAEKQCQANLENWDHAQEVSQMMAEDRHNE